ncbi:hypothetical protein ACGFKZ_23760 [Micromonospora tulbaghiae]|uniref:hypothetical protein n=1 Tax=Micromonospora tulbaghiae TaxID=479978 RepID=UPI0037117CFE
MSGRRPGAPRAAGRRRTGRLIRARTGGRASASPAPAARRTVPLASSGRQPVARSSSLCPVRRSLIIASP